MMKPIQIVPENEFQSVADYIDARLRKPDGKPYGKRAKQLIKKKIPLPVIKIGWCEVVHVATADDVLRQYAQHKLEAADPGRRGPGRPRKC